MHGYTLNILLNHSIVLAAIAGIVRFHYLHKVYWPFLLFIWLGLVNESISLVLIYRGGYNTINANIYVLIEYLLLLYQFYTWNESHASKHALFAWLGVAVWIADNLVWHRLGSSNSLFRAWASFILICFSIDLMTRMIVYEKRRLLYHTTFLICTGFLLYYGCKVFVEVFHLFGVPLSYPFYRHLWLTLSVINCISNIIYAIAIVCIPTRQEFTLPY